MIALSNYEAAVASYISDRHAEIAALDAQLSTCEQDTQALMCLTLEKIEQAEAICVANPDRCPGFLLAASGALSPISEAQDLFNEPSNASPCHRCLGSLLALPSLVETAQKPIAECQKAKTTLQAELNILETFVDPGIASDPLPLEWPKLQGNAAPAIDAAKIARNEMDEHPQRFCRFERPVQP